MLHSGFYQKNLSENTSKYLKTVVHCLNILDYTSEITSTLSRQLENTSGIQGSTVHLLSVKVLTFDKTEHCFKSSSFSRKSTIHACIDEIFHIYYFNNKSLLQLEQ